MRNRYRKGINVYIDEHLPSELKKPFQEANLRTLEIAKTKKYAGRDEFDYIPELLSENAIFVTSDSEFIRKVINQNTKHAGIVHIPDVGEKFEKIALAELTAYVILGALDGSSSVHNKIFYLAYDGLHVRENGKDTLVISLDWLNNIR